MTGQKEETKPPVLEYDNGSEKVLITNLAGVQQELSEKARKVGVHRDYTQRGARRALKTHGITYETIIGDEQFFDLAKVKRLPAFPLRGFQSGATQQARKEKQARALNLASKGVKVPQIATTLNVAATTVYGWLNQAKREEQQEAAQ